MTTTDPTTAPPTTAPVTNRPDRTVVLLLPGQGAQQVRMAAGLYRHEPVFTDAVETVFGLLGTEGDRLRQAWLAQRTDPLFDDVSVAQPLLYAIDHALGAMVLARGIRPACLLGHSVGEMAAATLAGVFDVADGVRLMRDRVRAFADSAPGGMLVVAAGIDDVAPVLGAGVVVGAHNGPRQLMLAGPAEPLAAARARLQAMDVTCLPVRARQGFHSPMLAAAAAGSIPQWAATELAAPRIPVQSAYRPGPLDHATATDPRFWAGQPAAPVLFGPALDQLLATGDRLLVECGPGQSLTMLARRHPAVARGDSAVLPLLPARSGDPEQDRRSVAAALDRLRQHTAPAVPTG